MDPLKARLPWWITFSLDDLGNLWRLGLSYNQFSGEIPPELGKLARLEILGLSHNNSSGEIPPELANLRRLDVLEIRYNRLTGQIPQAFENHPVPLGLYSEGNQFTGCISDRLRQLLTKDSSPGLPDCGTPASRVSQPSGNPDLVVRNIARSGSGPVYASQTLTLQADVGNGGDAQASATTLRYYHSSDATISSRDSQIGTDRVGTVQPGRNSPQSIQITAPSSPGTYYYGACVDSVSGEADTTNNCSQALRVSIGTQPKPDLVVRSVDRGGSGPVYASQTLTLQADVENGGDAQASATTLRYYHSSDATISSRDSQIGTDRVGTVQPGRNSPQSIQITAPSSPGTYHYGACVDSVSGEADTTNNCSQALRVSIGTQPKPDLVVRSVDRGGSGPIYASQALTLQADVANSGDALASATTLRYYQSSDATISSRDSQIGTDRVGTLQPGRNSPQAIQITTPSSPGTYYYGACVDEVSGEADTANNCSADLSVSIGTQPKPDLVVSNITRSGSGPIYASQTLTLQADVANSGDALASATTLRYYQSSDATISSRDSQIGTDKVGTVQPGRNSPQSIQITAPSSPGTYHYGACVDSVSGEADTTNNCSRTLRVSIGTQPKPDLVVRSVDRGGSGNVITGQQFTLRAEVENTGDGRANATTLRYYRSSDMNINTSDAPVGTSQVDSVQSGRNSAESVQVPAPSRSGTYYYGACVDAVSGESNPNNNCSSYVQVDVVDPAKPDLVITQFRTDDKSVEPGANVALSLTVRNQGDGASNATSVSFYVSPSRQVATTSSNRLQYGGNVRAFDSSPDQEVIHFSITAPNLSGTYYIRICIYALRDESNTQNNCSDTDYIEVEEPAKPDLVITEFSPSERRPTPGERINLTAVLSNQGNALADSSYITIYVSRDSQVAATSNNEVINYITQVLSASPDTQRMQMGVNAPTETGHFFYRICVNPVMDESDTSNNCSSAERVLVEEAVAPDLGTTPITAGDGAILYTWDPRTPFSALVWNEGDGASTPTILRFYYSSDSSITPSTDILVGQFNVDILSPGRSREISIRGPAPEEEGTYYYYTSIDTVPGESDTRNNCAEEAVNVLVLEPVFISNPECGRNFSLIPPGNNYYFRGTIHAMTNLRGVTVRGWVAELEGGTYIDEGGALGTMSAGMSKDFSIEGFLGLKYYIGCTISWSWEY